MGNMCGRKWTRIADNRRMERSEEGIVVFIFTPASTVSLVVIYVEC